MPSIDLGQLLAPDVVEPLNYESLLNERKATLVSLYPEQQQAAIARTLTLESEPIVKLLEENAYRELMLRQRINEAAKAVMLAYAKGPDLDQIAANFNVVRLTVQAADPTVSPPLAAVYESDSALRLRTPQAFEGLSVAGPTGAYECHALSADGRVADASAISPSPACVTITVLSREGDGTAPPDLLANVAAALNDENVRPVADRVTVQSAVIVPYAIDATLYLYPGPEAEPARVTAKARLASFTAKTRVTAFITEQRRLGRDIRLSALYATLHVEGVQRVDLKSPPADMVLDPTQAAFCTGYRLAVGGMDE